MKNLLHQNWQKLLVSLLICFYINITASFASSNASSEESFFEYKHEIGINASQLLSNLLSLNINNSPNTPFGIYYSYHKKKTTIRIGVNALYKKQRDFLSSTSGDRQLMDYAFGTRLTIEKNITILPRLNMQAGIDGIAQNIHEESTIANQFFTSINTLILGGGPALRMIFKVNKHINISTECTAYGTVGFKEQRVQLGIPRPEIKTATDIGFSLTMPTSLYISILF